MVAIHGRYRSGSHFFYASDYVCLYGTHGKSYFLFLPSTNHSAHPRLRLFAYIGLLTLTKAMETEAQLIPLIHGCCVTQQRLTPVDINP